MSRTNWYTDHPLTCTCSSCQEQKAFQLEHGNKKIGRNEKCPCGSGSKYKKCHGA
tara:strand:+ start:65 stop:229 length:165 start_codon:yes stop_codon:yes gene_type:complete